MKKSSLLLNPKMNKKAIFYLLITSLFIAVMIIIFVAYKEYSYTDRQKVVETRIITINDFIKSMDTDSKRVIYISGFRSLIALEDYVARTGNYLNDTEGLFRIAFYNGTVNGTQVEVLINSSYYDYLQKLRVISSGMGVDVDINVTNITLYHESPWSVTVIVTTHINITDKKGLANWEFDKDYNTTVSLINIRDPLYSVATYGRVPNTIRISSIPPADYVIESTNDTTGLMTLVNNSYYVASPLAPSFLMRLEGNFTNSTYGIESFVNLIVLVDQGIIPSPSKSIIDYILFTNITGFEDVVCDVDNMPDWFVIDKNHTSTYEVTKLNYTDCSP